MSSYIEIGVEKDHIESLTKANGINALSELIWNALDADATIISIEYVSTKIGGYESIIVKDNGSGLDYISAQDVFGKIGGSNKKTANFSPSGRSYHGKEGKGRYKALALGDLVTFTSRYHSNSLSDLKEFSIIVDRNRLSKSELTPSKNVTELNSETGFKVLIQNINTSNANQALDEKNRQELAQKFASYWINYQNFSILINGNKLEFESLIRNEFAVDGTSIIVDGFAYSIQFKIIEWNYDMPKKTYLCNDKGVSFRELNLGIRSPLPISIFIQSIIIEKLHKESRLDNIESNEWYNSLINEAKKVARKYVKDRLHRYSREFISDLKAKGLYPYKESSDGDLIEESKRQVFDIVTLQINEFLPDFEKQDDKSKKFVLSLIKEALENNSSSLQTILKEVIELPTDKIDELADILKETSLSSMIDTMTEIKNRLSFIRGLEELVYNKDLSKNVLERKHLHKILVNETWIFGDEYTYGADDITLKNVLKEYIKHLGREDFEEIVNSENNDDLQIIPDVCLWKQFPLGQPGHKTNLIIELKKPTVDAGSVELTQIKNYATKIMKDNRFPKENTKWKFILITRKTKEDIEVELSQSYRQYGHVISNDSLDVYVFTWGQILNDAKARYEFIKNKLNVNLMDNEQNLDYLKSKYSEYLPNDI